MATEPQAGLRKRQQIASANKAMFLWVAGASVIVGAALVVAVFLVNKLVFTEKVIEKKQVTASTLSSNLDSIDKLKSQILVLNTNTALKSVMAPGETDPIQVVLDALPSQANSTALGSSLQEKFLNQPGLTVETLSVDPPQGQSAPTTGTGAGTAVPISVGSTTANTSVSSNIITFNFSANATDSQTIANLLQSLEKSIRTIDLTNVSLSYSAGRLTLTADGQAYYQPQTTPQLSSEKVKP